MQVTTSTSRWNKHRRRMFDLIRDYDGKDENTLYTASLLCRYYNDFELERRFVDRALSVCATSDYMLERLRWHELTWFEKLTPRTPLPLSPENTNVPKDKTLDNLCIVLAADDRYFEFLVECIESIKSTCQYKQTDIKILDVGLGNRQYFIDRWGIEPIAPGWPVDCHEIHFFPHYLKPPYNVKVPNYIDNQDYYSVPRSEITYAQAVLIKPFMHELFPDYDYYLWIDSDCWIQDERGLDRFICLAEEQGHAFPGAFVPEASNPDLGTHRVPESWFREFTDKPNTATSVFCTSRSFQKVWGESYRQAGSQCGFWWGQEEEVASYCMIADPEVIEFSEILYLYRHFGMPVVKAGESVLRNPESLEVIPILGLGLDKHRYFYPVAQYENDKLTRRDLLNCVKAIGLDVDWSTKTPELFEDQRQVSFRFRSIPDEEYKKLDGQIQRCTELLANLPNRVKQSSNMKISETEDDIRMFGSPLRTHEFVALREAQVIVKMREDKIMELESALRFAQDIVSKQEARLREFESRFETDERMIIQRNDQYQVLDNALREAQDIVTRNNEKIEVLELGLRDAQSLVEERDNKVAVLEVALTEAQEVVKCQAKKVGELDLGLQDAQEIAAARSDMVTLLQSALKESQEIADERGAKAELMSLALREAQSIVKEQSKRIEELEPAFRYAQKIVKERDSQISKLDPALEEAQSIVKEQTKRIEELESALRYAQKIVEERDSQISKLDPALREAHDIVTAQNKKIKTLEHIIQEVRNLST